MKTEATGIRLGRVMPINRAVCRQHFDRSSGRPACMEPATRPDGLCERCHFEAFKRRHAQLRGRWLCRDCGACRVDRSQGEARCAPCRVMRRLKRRDRARRDPKRQARAQARAERDYQRRNPDLSYPHALLSMQATQRGRFVHAYAWTGNGELSAIAAGYGLASAARGGRAAAVRACRLLRDPRVQAALADQRRIIAEQPRVRTVVRDGDGRFLPATCAVPGFNVFEV